MQVSFVNQCPLQKLRILLPSQRYRITFCCCLYHFLLPIQEKMRGYNPFDSVSFLIQIFSSSDHGISFVVPIRISRVFLVTNFSSILSWDCPGIPSNFSKISGQYHQYDQLKSLHHNIIIIITPYGFSCKISPEATSELAASLKQDVGIYSSTSTALSPHRSGKRIQPQCQYFSPFKPMVLTCASTQANRRHMDSQ